MQDVNEGEDQELEGVLEDRHQKEVVAEKGLIGEEPQAEGPKKNQQAGTYLCTLDTTWYTKR